MKGNGSAGWGHGSVPVLRGVPLCRLVLMCVFAVGKNRKKLKFLKRQLSSIITGGSSFRHFGDCVHWPTIVEKLRLDKIGPKTISYGAGNSKFLKTEIGWISDFGRTSASQQKIILWDSGN